MTKTDAAKLGPRRYEITITEIGQERRVAGAEWKEGAGDRGPNHWGYTPEIEKVEPYSREIFRQQVADLDLWRVVQAVNTPDPNTPTEDFNRAFPNPEYVGKGGS